jgi:hypothetical protein
MANSRSGAKSQNFFKKEKMARPGVTKGPLFRQKLDQSSQNQHWLTRLEFSSQEIHALCNSGEKIFLPKIQNQNRLLDSWNFNTSMQKRLYDSRVIYCIENLACVLGWVLGVGKHVQIDTLPSSYQVEWEIPVQGRKARISSKRKRWLDKEWLKDRYFDKNLTNLAKISTGWLVWNSAVRKYVLYAILEKKSFFA